MKSTVAATCLLAALACVEFLPAHGGMYRGPGDTVPPNPGGRGGRTPGIGTPGTPGPGRPGTPGPGGPGVPGPGGPYTPGTVPGAPGTGPTTGMDLATDDLNRWEFWWEFNKDPFINLKSAVADTGTTSDLDEIYIGAGRRVVHDTLLPSESQILGTVLPKLSLALESTEQRDIVSSCMIAMAKVGKNTDQINILQAFRKHLTEKDQEVRETAAIAMGISQMTEAVPNLIDLARDTPAGRKLCDRDGIDYRTRSFSIYGLGLIAYATADHAVKSQIFGTLKDILASDKAPERDIRVAAINAIALLAPSPTSEDGKRLLSDAFGALDAYWNQDVGVGEQVIQAHVPPAIAKLCQNIDRRDPELSPQLETMKRDWISLIDGKGQARRVSDALVQSAIVALGRTCSPVDPKSKEKSVDRDAFAALETYAGTGKDEQARYFSLMALGQIGGDSARDVLLGTLRNGKKALERPWAAISLGVLCFRAAEAAGPDAKVDTFVGAAIHKQLNEVKTPSSLAAFGVALGLANYREAAPDLRDLLDRQKNQDELAGYLCIGLALMKDPAAIGPIQEIVEISARRTLRLQQAAIALGKLGDKQAARTLLEMLTDADGGQPDLAKMSAIASALGFIGDSRTIDPLVKLLFDTRLTDLSRAFAAVALGGVADKELLRWSSKLSVNMNYRAAVETLTNQAAGILDIL